MNNYYTRVYDFEPNTTIRSGQADDELNAVLAGFDLLPTDNTALKRGTNTWGIESGSNNSYVVTSGESRLSYQNGDHIAFLITHVNTGACTLNVDGVGAVSFVRADGANYEGGELLNNTIIEARYDNTNSRWQSTVLHVDDGATVDIGAVVGSSTALPTVPGLFDANLPWQNVNNIEIASLGFNNDIDFSYVNNVYGGDHIFQGYDSGGTIRTLLTLNPVSRSATVETLNATTAIQENGVNINTLYQPLDADLTALAALTTSAYGLSLLETISEANFKQFTNLEIGIDVQAHASNLDTLSSYGVLDEDDLLSDSDIDVPTQQSVKAYVDAGIAAGVTAEIVQDFMGPAISGGAQTLITVTYNDPSNQFDFAVEPSLSNYTIDAGFQESIEDLVGAMFSGNTETLITATYQDVDGTIDLVVDNDLANYDNTNSGFAELSALNTFTNTLEVSNTTPIISLKETDAPADEKRWDFRSSVSKFIAQIRDDSGLNPANWLEVDRTGTTVDTINFPNGTLQYGGQEVAIAADIPTTEEIQDIVGVMVSGNTETLISVTYDDAGNSLDFAVEPNLSSYTIDAGFQESIEDLVGAMFSGNTEDGISATYQDADGTIDLAVNADLTTDVTGILPEANGGTGVSALSSLNLSDFTNNIILTKVLTASVNFTSTTTFADVSDLSGFTIPAGVWKFEVEGVVTCAAASVDFKYGFQVNSGSLNDSHHLNINGNTTAPVAPSASLTDIFTSTQIIDIPSGPFDESYFRSFGYIDVNTELDVDFQAAQNSSSATSVTLVEGAIITFTRVS